MPTREDAQALDAGDRLRGFQDRFRIAPDGVIYLDGNSLGRLPKETVQRIGHVIERQWGERLIRSWSEGWMELPETIGDRLAEGLLGAAQGQTAIGDSTTVCFYKLASAALAARPGRTQIVTDRDNFPTDRYVLEGLAQQHNCTIRWIEADPARGPEPRDVELATNDNTALVTFSQVNYRSAYILETRQITQIAHAHGALMLWDLCHSAGAIPVNLDRDEVDLAVGCTYKYLNAGPGAPAFMYVATRHQADIRQPIWGWLGRTDPFEMAQGYIPASGIRRLLSGTPPVLALTAAGVGIDLSIEAGIDEIRAKSKRITQFAIELIDERLADLNCSVGSPRDADQRGSHVALVHPDARTLSRQLTDEGVIVDFRTPDVIRLGLSPLTTSYVDVYDGLDRLGQMLSRRPRTRR